MAVKVHSVEQNLQSHEVKDKSKFHGLIFFLSKMFILPLRYNEDGTQFEFSFLHVKTLIWTIIYFMPTTLSVLWWTLQGSFLEDYTKHAKEVYTLFDFYFIISMQVFMILPNQFIIIMTVCTHWKKFSELSLECKFSHMKTMFLFLVVFEMSGLLIALGSFLTIGKLMTQYSLMENMMNHIISYIIPFAWNRFFDTIAFFMWICHIQTMKMKIENPPHLHRRQWIFDTITYYEKFQKHFNTISLELVPPSQVYWLIMCFLSVGLSFGTKNINIFSLIVVMSGFFLLSIGYLILLKIYLFNIHDLNERLKNIQVSY